MKSSLAFVAIVAGTIAACAGPERVPPPSAPPQPPPASDTDPLAGKSPEKANVRIAEDIRRACGISDADAHFAFNSARVSAADYPTFTKLAQCFATGPLAKRQMQLVGHADPRGSDEYNLVLGGSRADRVKAVLVERGLAGEQVSTTSRGEMDARGRDDSSWAEDRRVDIQLAN